MDEVLKIALEAQLPELHEDTPEVLEGEGMRSVRGAERRGAETASVEQRTADSGQKKGRLGVEPAFCF